MPNQSGIGTDPQKIKQDIQNDLQSSAQQNQSATNVGLTSTNQSHIQKVKADIQQDLQNQQ
jgi:hypothetical protein